MRVMGCETSAKMNIQRNLRFRPRSRVRERVPYVWTTVQFAAGSVSACKAIKLLGSKGMTLPLAPVYTRNSLLVVRSLTLGGWQFAAIPVSCAATTNREPSFPVSFPEMCNPSHTIFVSSKSGLATYNNLPRMTRRFARKRSYCSYLDEG